MIALAIFDEAFFEALGSVFTVAQDEDNNIESVALYLWLGPPEDNPFENMDPEEGPGMPSQVITPSAMIILPQDMPAMEVTHGLRLAAEAAGIEVFTDDQITVIPRPGQG